MAPPDPDGRIGTVLDGRYRIIEPLSRGGMGVVYRAERIPVGRPVAVKFLHALFADDPDSRVRFERETRALSKLAHPHCVGIIDFGFQGAPYLVMDLVAGATLRDMLDDGPLAIDDALALTRQLLAGLAHAHAEGIVHRDVKPANVMVTDEIGTGRHARILDFGLARLRETGHGPNSTSITQTSIVVGTPSYMAPEQTMGGSVDARTDVYAVGILLFEMVTGNRPFVADDTASLLEMHRRMPPPRLRQVDPAKAWPAGLDDVIQQALAKEPEDRWQSAVEFAQALERVGRRATDAAAAAGAAGEKKRSSAAGVLAVLILAGGAATAGYLMMKKEPARETVGVGVGVGAGAADGGSAAAAAAATDAATAAAAAAAAAAGTGSGSDVVAEVVTDAGEVADAVAEADAAAVAVIEIDAGVESDAAGGDGSEVAIDEDDIQLEPLPPADPEIEAVDQQAPVAEGETVEPVVIEPPPLVAEPARPPPKTVREALALAKTGHRDEAIAGLRALWKKQPGNANLPFVLGNLYFEKRWWSVSMEHYQAAIKRAAAYRRNGTLIRNTISMLSSPKTRGHASWFLRKVIGGPAKAPLRTAAKRHKSAAVRKQAAAVLRRF